MVTRPKSLIVNIVVDYMNFVYYRVKKYRYYNGITY